MAKILRNNLGLVYILLWVTFMVIHFTLLYQGYGMAANVALAESLVFNLIFALLGGGLWFMVRYADLQAKTANEQIMYHLSGATVTIGVWIAVSYFILNKLFADNLVYRDFLSASLFFRVIAGIMFYALLVTIYYLLLNYKELREKSQREAQLNSLLRESELNMLRSQIRPHFLFNSLNSISALTMTDPAKAQEMVIKLSEYMRYTLNLPDSMISPLEKELYHTELYLEIEKVRFGNRLEFEKQIQADSMEWPVPVMILQPLVENAVKYGVYESSETTGIRIEAQTAGEFLSIRITNNYDPEATARKGTGTGLKNIPNTKDHFVVHLSIPKDVRKNTDTHR